MERYNPILQCGVEVLEYLVAKQHHIPGYNPPSVSWSQQTAKLPAQVPHPIGKHYRSALEGATVGSPFHREREFSVLFTSELYAECLLATASFARYFRYCLCGTTGTRIFGLRALLYKLH
jgi:hypothetical protein